MGTVLLGGIVDDSSIIFDLNYRITIIKKVYRVDNLGFDIIER